MIGGEKKGVKKTRQAWAMGGAMMRKKEEEKTLKDLCRKEKTERRTSGEKERKREQLIRLDERFVVA